MNSWKVIQRRTYDILSHKYSLLILVSFFLGTIILLSVIEVGEVWILLAQKRPNGKESSWKETSSEKLCIEGTAIDAVYTWVNGSDPLLLRNLELYRNKKDENEGWKECPYRDCEPSHFIVYRGYEQMPKTVWENMRNVNVHWPPVFLTGPSLKYNRSNETLMVFKGMSIADAGQAAHIKFGMNASLSQAYWTTDLGVPEAYPASEWVRLSGLMPKFLSTSIDTLKKKLSENLQLHILEVWPFPEHGCVILLLSSIQAVDHVIVQSGVLTIGKDVVVASRLVLALAVSTSSRNDRYAPSRFEDKDELRYSLRSLEKHAPWIRHVYLVTNGQIPHWLDLDNPHITVVTHSDIFPNKSHLPTFSSPAIESHLHRITGLSKKFLYLNDDILFAKDVWPEDFYTNSKGYKVYLSWPVPDCSPSCLWSWVSDGSCDIECNVAECDYDGGDCNETDSGPLTPQGPPLREDLSLYDDYMGDNFYDQGISNVEGHNAHLDYLDMPIINVNDDQKNYHRKDNMQRNDKHEPQDERVNPVTKRNNTQLQNQYLLPMKTPIQSHSRGVNEQNTKASPNEHRSKRAVVKKNLGSHVYAGSSMIAGISGDFFGSVADSEAAIQRAKHAADNLRLAEHLYGTSRNHTRVIPSITNRTQEDIWNEFSHQFKSDLGKLNATAVLNMSKETKVTKLKSKSLLDNNEEVHGKRNLSIIVNHTSSHEWNLSRTDILNVHNNSRLRHIKEPFDTEQGKTWLHQTKLNKTKGRLHNLLTNDLNESVDLVITKKERLKRLRNGRSKPRILDSFAESLLHVNMLYNRVYGFETRRVPAHAPHLIDKHIMSELQERFPKEWEETSVHKLRSPQDMQFAFSYFYYLMSEEVNVSLQELFDTYDTDKSGTWSDREIRTLLTRVYPAPLNPHHLIQFEDYVLSCARNIPPTETPLPLFPTPMYERYQDSPLPTVTWQLVRDCTQLRSLLITSMGRRHKYQFEIVREWNREVTFKMLTSNVSHLVGHLDDIRRSPKKFVCLNDNLDPKQESENAMVRAVLRDFYHSLFPMPSRFELPLDMRNRFLHVSELNEWKHGRARLRTAIIFAVITLSLLTLAILYPDEIRHYGRCFYELVCARRRRFSRGRCRSRSPRESV